MIHDGMLSRTTRDAQATDRRRGMRVPFPTEMIIRWFSDMRSPVRYAIIDAADGGFRIRTSLPVMEGMTGVIMMLLPEGKSIDQTVAVAWTRNAEDGVGFEAGLRVMEST